METAIFRPTVDYACKHCYALVKVEGTVCGDRTACTCSNSLHGIRILAYAIYAACVRFGDAAKGFAWYNGGALADWLVGWLLYCGCTNASLLYAHAMHV